MALNNKSKPCGALVGEKFGKLTVFKKRKLFLRVEKTEYIQLANVNVVEKKLVKDMVL